MLNRKIAMPTGWQHGWLERDLPAMENYITVLLSIILIASIFLLIRSALTIRRARKELALNEDGTRRNEIISTADKKMKGITKGHLGVAITLLLNVFAICIVDAVIASKVLVDDAKSEPGAWNGSAIVEVVLYSAYLFLLFSTAFFVVPTLQIMLAMHLVKRARINHGFNLANRIPEARFLTSIIAQFWCLLAFVVMVYWVPVGSGHSLARFIVNQASIGSAVTWINVSFTLMHDCDSQNCAMLSEEQLEAAEGGWTRVVLDVVGKTLKAVHWRSGRQETLPQYEDVSDVKYTDEKIEVV